MVVKALPASGQGTYADVIGGIETFADISSDVAALERINRLSASLAADGLTVRQGVFGAYMDVASHNDGPICILLDSKRQF